MPSIVRPDEFFFTLGGLAGTSYEIGWRRDHLHYLSRSADGVVQHESIQPDAADWQRFWRQLESLGVWQWDGEYDDLSVRDGTSWGLELMYKDQQVVCSGMNAFPPRGKGPSMPPPFRRFLQALSELLGGLELR